MNRMLKTIIIVITVLTITSSTLTARAEPQESPELIRIRYQRQRLDLADKLRTQKVELMKLMSLDNPNSQHVKKKLSQILQTEEERQFLFVDEMFALRSCLSAQEWRNYRREIIFKMMDKKGR